MGCLSASGRFFKKFLLCLLASVHISSVRLLLPCMHVFNNAFLSIDSSCLKVKILTVTRHISLNTVKRDEEDVAKLTNIIQSNRSVDFNKCGKYFAANGYELITFVYKRYFSFVKCFLPIRCHLS